MSAPKLRFCGHVSEWSTEQIKNITSYVDYRGKTPEKSESGVFLVTAKNIRQGYIDYKSSEEFIPTTSYEEVMRRGKPEIGDVVITTEAPLGYVASIDRNDIALAQRVIKFRGKASILHNNFLKYSLLSVKFQKELNEKATGGTVKGIKGSVLHKMKLTFPEITEQTKIANFLTAVDEKIAQITRKHDLLIQYKKGVMQQIFSQWMRFKDDDGQEFTEWTVSTLGNVCRIKTGKKDVNQGNPSGQYPFFTCAREHTWSDTYSFEGEAILIAGNGEVGNLNYCNGKFEAYQRTYVLQNFSFNTDYLWQYLKSFLTQSLGVGKVGSSVPYIKLGSLIEFEIFAPSSKKEQTKIANFLSAIDDKITAAKTQLEAVKQYKQGLLQQMFV